MRVALVSPYSWSRPGGVRTHVTGLARCLRARGVEVDVIVPADGDATFPGVISVGRTVPIRDNGSVVRVALGPAASRRVARLVSSPWYDLVHVHEPMIPAVSLTAVVASAAPVVGTFHMYASDPGWYRPFAPLCRNVLGRLEARIAVSEAARRHVARSCPGDYRVIPNAIDVVPLAAFRASRTGSRVLFVGRPEARKGLPVLLEAFRRLPGSTRLDLVGPTPDDVARAGLALDRAALARIRAHGRIDEAARDRLLAEADVLCAPSLSGESFGLVLLEGMAAGLPVVASAVPGYTELLPAAAGRLVPPGDAGALAGALRGLLADGSLRARLGKAGRQEARRYDWSLVVEEMLEVYEGVLARRGCGRAA